MPAFQNGPDEANTVRKNKGHVELIKLNRRAKTSNTVYARREMNNLWIERDGDGRKIADTWSHWAQVNSYQRENVITHLYTVAAAHKVRILACIWNRR
jgi:hypothetical protein